MKYYLILFAMLFGPCLNAQVDSLYYDYDEESGSLIESTAVNPGVISQQRGYDEAPIVVQRFDRAKWKQVVGNEDFEEVKRLKKQKPEATDSANSKSKKNGKRIDRGEDDDSEADESSTITISPILTFLVYAVAIGIIGYILFLIINNTSFKSNKKITKPQSPNDVSTSVSEIKELEIDRLLREAMSSGNYRLAIRICFLGLLKKLDEDGFIIWKKDKTNRDYLSELYLKARHYEEVRKLTLAYELVWYGDHDLEMQYYQEIISSFKTMNQKLNASNAK